MNIAHGLDPFNILHLWYISDALMIHTWYINDAFIRNLNENDSIKISYCVFTIMILKKKLEASLPPQCMFLMNKFLMKKVRIPFQIHSDVKTTG